MKALLELERLGYVFTTDGETIHYRAAETPVDCDRVRQLLAAVAKERASAIQFLAGRSTGMTPAEEEMWWQSVFAERGIDDPGSDDFSTEFEQVLNEWQADPDESHTPMYARRYAALAIRVRFPFFDDEGVDWGAAGWRYWAHTTLEQGQSTGQRLVEVPLATEAQKKIMGTELPRFGSTPARNDQLHAI